MTPERHLIDTPDGWRLDARHYRDPEAFRPERPPLMFVPGYCMNTFPLSFHPRGVSMVEFLIRRGFDVWTVNLRSQGDSESDRHAGRVGFDEIARVDMKTARDFVAEASGHESIDVVGCSLGGTFLFTYLALHPDDHGVRRAVGLGAPLTWVQRSLLMRAMTLSPSLAAAVKIRGTRNIARRVLPFTKRVPGALSMYMNTERIDLSRTDLLVQTVDDPHPRLNAQVARWVKERELTVRGVNISRALQQVQVPYLGIYGNADGIVFPSVARAAAQSLGGPTELIEAGDRDNAFGHADLFINDEAAQHVFEPLADWLTRDV